MNPLVSTDWLAQNLGRVVVLDATYYLPAEGKNAKEEFEKSHIPGARMFDIDAISDQDTTLPHMLPAVGRFERMLGELGVSTDSTVVFYDQKGLFSSARAWWMMGVFGSENARILEGGLPRWLKDGRPTASGEVEPATKGEFRADFRAVRVRGIGDMLANVTSHNDLVVDVRAGPRFRAEVAEPRPGMRSGHIPGAVNLPFTELFGADGMMLPPAELRSRLAAVGVDGSRPVVTSCGSGVTATIVTLAMVVAGLPPGAVYDGSWTEWGGRADTPIAGEVRHG